MVIISGNSNVLLAKEIANLLKYEFIKADTISFLDTELKVKISGKISKKDVIIIQSLSQPVNDNLIELLFIIDAVKRANANKIQIIIPYFAYSRQNHIEENSPLPIALIIKLIEVAGADNILTLDLHDKDIEKLFNIRIINISPVHIFSNCFQNKCQNLVVVSPDIGGKKRAKEFADYLGCSFAIINKVRIDKTNLEMNLIEGNVKNKDCLIVDDIVDSANTICKAAEFLTKNAALSVRACVTHAILSADSIKKIDNLQLNPEIKCLDISSLEGSLIKELFITNSILREALPQKVRIVSCAPILSKFIQCG